MAAVMCNHMELVTILITFGATVNCYKVYLTKWVSLHVTRESVV